MASNYYEKKEEIIKLEKNILSWYPFKKDAQILEINTGIEQIQDIGLYDYILINGIEEKENGLEEYLVFAKQHLKENGTILFTVDNKFGIQNTKTNPEYKVDDKNRNLMSKEQIEEILKKQEFKNYKFYYPLPNYKIANIIFTDQILPNCATIYRDLTLYDENDILIFDERKVYKDIITENAELFKLFANSYLVEVSNKEENNIGLICFGNSRKEKYRMKTVISDKYVYKQNMYECGKEHLQNIKNNIDILNKLKINTLDTYEEDKIISKLIKETPTLDKVLIELFEKQEYEQFDKLIEKFIVFINEKLNIMQNKNKITVFEKYNISIDEKIKNKLHYTEYGLYDLIFQNCFYMQNEFYFFDQEWREENIPIEFILYRAIFFLSNSKSEIDTKALYKKFNLTEYLKIFETLENVLQKQIKDEQIWTRHAMNNTTVTDVYNKKVHYRNLKSIAEKELEEEKKSKTEEIKGKDELIQKKDKQIKELTQKINYMQNSKSWKATKFLRVIKSKMSSERKRIQNGTKKKS